MKKQPKKSIERLLSQKSYTGADMGRLCLLDMVNVFKGDPDLSFIDTVKKINSIDLYGKQLEIFNDYMVVKDCLMQNYSSCRMTYMEFLKGRDNLLITLHEIIEKERSYRQYLDQPLLMTSAEYSRLLKKSGKAPKDAALNLAAVRFVRDILDGADVPGEVREEFDALKDIPLQDADKVKFLLRFFSEKYCLPCDELKIREFILDALSFSADLNAAEKLPTDALIERFESVVKAACKSAEIEHDARYLKDRPTDRQGLLVRLCELKETQLADLDQFQPFLDAVGKFPVEEEDKALAVYLSGLKDADFIRRNKALAGLAVCHVGAGIDTEKNLFAKYSKMNFLDGKNFAEADKVYSAWITEPLKFTYGTEAHFEVTGNFLGVDLTILSLTRDIDEKFKLYNDAVMLAYVMAAGSPDAADLVRGRIKATFKPIREADYKMSDARKKELLDQLDGKNASYVANGDYYTQFYTGEDVIYG